MVALWSNNRTREIVLVLAVIIASIGVVIYKIDDSAFTFYMVFSRAWELGFGALAAVIRLKYRFKGNAFIALIGLVLVVCGYFAISKDSPHFFLMLSLPILGSFLIVLFASKENLVGKILSLPIVVFIGLISYSLYLWHVPLLIYVKYIFGDDLFTTIVYFFILVLFSYLSFQFIERPFRNRNLMKTSTVLISISIVSSWLVYSGVQGHLNGGYPDRSPVFSKLRHNNGWGVPCNGNTGVTASCANALEPNTAILGNSYAMTFVNPLKDSLEGGVVQLTQDSCALGYVDKIDDFNALPCEEFYRKSVETIVESDSIKTVFLSSPFNKELSNEHFRKSFLQLLTDLRDKKVILIGPTPYSPVNIGECFSKNVIFGFDKSCDFEMTPNNVALNKGIQDAVASLNFVEFYDVSKIICPAAKCRMMIDETSTTYVDRGHLSYDGAMSVLSHLRQEQGLSLN
jgi:hypothetical protein